MPFSGRPAESMTVPLMTPSDIGECANAPHRTGFGDGAVVVGTAAVVWTAGVVAAAVAVGDGVSLGDASGVSLGVGDVSDGGPCASPAPSGRLTATATTAPSTMAAPSGIAARRSERTFTQVTVRTARRTRGGTAEPAPVPWSHD